MADKMRRVLTLSNRIVPAKQWYCAISRFGPFLLCVQPLCMAFNLGTGCMIYNIYMPWICPPMETKDAEICCSRAGLVSFVPAFRTIYWRLEESLEFE